MPNYSLVTTAGFTPLSFDQYLKPYQIYTEAYNKQADQIYELRAKSGIWENLVNEQADPVAYAQYKQYADRLRNASDQLLQSNRMSPQLMADIFDLRSDYASQITPLESAYNRRAEQAKSQREMLLKDPTYMFQKLASQQSLDDYLKNPMYDVTGTGYSGMMIQKDVELMAKNFKNQVLNYGNLGNIDEVQRLYFVNRGISPEAIMAALKNPQDPNNAPVLQAIMDSVIESSGVKQWATPDQLDAFYHRAANGLVGGIGETTVGSYSDYAAQQRIAHDYAMRQKQAEWAHSDAEKDRDSIMKLATELAKKGEFGAAQSLLKNVGIDVDLGGNQSDPLLSAIESELSGDTISLGNNGIPAAPSLQGTNQNTAQPGVQSNAYNDYVRWANDRKNKTLGLTDADKAFFSRTFGQGANNADKNNYMGLYRLLPTNKRDEIRRQGDGNKEKTKQLITEAFNKELKDNKLQSVPTLLDSVPNDLKQKNKDKPLASIAYPSLSNPNSTQAQTQKANAAKQPVTTSSNGLYTLWKSGITQHVGDTQNKVSIYPSSLLGYNSLDRSKINKIGEAIDLQIDKNGQVKDLSSRSTSSVVVPFNSAGSTKTKPKLFDDRGHLYTRHQFITVNGRTAKERQNLGEFYDRKVIPSLNAIGIDINELNSRGKVPSKAYVTTQFKNLYEGSGRPQQQFFELRMPDTDKKTAIGTIENSISTKGYVNNLDVFEGFDEHGRIKHRSSGMKVDQFDTLVRKKGDPDGRIKDNVSIYIPTNTTGDLGDYIVLRIDGNDYLVPVAKLGNTIRNAFAEYTNNMKNLDRTYSPMFDKGVEILKRQGYSQDQAEAAVMQSMTNGHGADYMATIIDYIQTYITKVTSGLGTTYDPGTIPLIKQISETEETE